VPPELQAVLDEVTTHFDRYAADSRAWRELGQLYRAYTLALWLRDRDPAAASRMSAVLPPPRPVDRAIPNSYDLLSVVDVEMRGSSFRGGVIGGIDFDDTDPHGRHTDALTWKPRAISIRPPPPGVAAVVRGDDVVMRIAIPGISRVDPARLDSAVSLAGSSDKTTSVGLAAYERDMQARHAPVWIWIVRNGAPYDIALATIVALAVACGLAWRRKQRWWSALMSCADFGLVFAVLFLLATTSVPGLADGKGNLTTLGACLIDVPAAVGVIALFFVPRRFAWIPAILVIPVPVIGVLFGSTGRIHSIALTVMACGAALVLFSLASRPPPTVRRVAGVILADWRSYAFIATLGVVFLAGAGPREMALAFIPHPAEVQIVALPADPLAPLPPATFYPFASAMSAPLLTQARDPRDGLFGLTLICALVGIICVLSANVTRREQQASAG